MWIGGWDELKQLEKNSLNALAFSSSEWQEVLPCIKEPICSTCLFSALTVFQNCLELEVFSLLKYFFLASRRWQVTLFRARLYCDWCRGDLDFLAFLKRLFLLRILCTKDLFNHGRFRRRGGRTFLGIHSPIMDRKVLCHNEQ